MALYSQHFYNSTYRKCLIAFGKLFNNIYVKRYDDSHTEVNRVRVPIAFGPKEKWVYRINQDPDFLNPINTNLPRMSFEPTSLTYDTDREYSPLQKMRGSTVVNTSYDTMFTPTPWNIGVVLNVFTSTLVDGEQIIEQILPFFTPDLTPELNLLGAPSQKVDVPIVFRNITHEDVWSGDFQDRRALIWTLDFTIKTYFFGPLRTAKRIEHVDITTYDLDSVSEEISLV